MAAKGTLYLIPTPLGEDAGHTLPRYLVDLVHRLDVFIAERVRSARRFIAATGPPRPIDGLEFHELNKRTPGERIPELLRPAREGRDIGLLSEAGCPGIADPGARVVELAHREGIPVRPVSGPSSLFLALMASGLNGQRFCFQGYLARQPAALDRDLRRLENLSARHRQTQLFMETPYRNNKLLAQALKSLSPDTRFCVAADLSLPGEWIRTRTMRSWREQGFPDLHKRPALFLLDAGQP